MKLNGILGTGSGKLGSSVFSVVGGVQVLREYNPDVFNPSTQPQIDQRARLKLMSQIASAFQPVNAFEKKKNVSARNKFISANYQYTYATGGVAEIKLEDVQLAEGSVILPPLTARRVSYRGIEVELEYQGMYAFQRVIYVMYAVTPNNDLIFFDSIVLESSADNPTYKYTFNNYEFGIVVYAYGMRDFNAAATAALGDYEVESGLDVARLVAQRSIIPAYYSFSRTQGIVISRDYSLYWNRVSLNNTLLPEDSDVELPYASSFAMIVRISSEVILDLLVDDGHFPYNVFTSANREYTGTISRLAGGEVIRFCIGKRISADEFQEVTWYPSVFKIAEQGAEFLSLSLNNNVIPNRDKTFVAIEELMTFVATSRNTINMSVRACKNGVRIFDTGITSGEAELYIDGLQLGDELSFDIGAKLISGFAVKAPFNGRVVITDTTPTITSFVVNGHECQRYETYGVPAGDNVQVTLLMEGCVGAHLLINRDNEGWEDTGVEIKTGILNYRLSIEVAEFVGLAIGWGNTPSAYFEANIVGR